MPFEECARTTVIPTPTDLKRHGLAGVRLVVSDQHAGLVAALRRAFQGVAHQRCRVHFARNLLALVPKTHTDMVFAVFRTIFAQPNPTPSPRAGTRSATSSPHGSRRSAR
jgi:transposase-like protein